MFEALPDWAIAGGVVILAILVGAWAHRIFTRVAGRAVRNAHPVVRSLFDKTAGPARLAFILLAIWLVMPMMPVAGLGGVFGTLFMVAVIGLIGWAAINAAEMGAELYLKGFDGPAADDPRARTHETQVRVLKRGVDVVIVLVTAGFALMTFEAGRQIGFSLFGMAGIGGVVVAFAAYPILKNLVAGVQLALTQPIHIGDTVKVEGQTGKIEDITASSVVLRLLDQRRQFVPLSVFMEKPLQNLPRESSDIVSTVTLQINDTVPVERVRHKLTEIVTNDPHWDGRVVNLEVADAKEGRVELCAAVSARCMQDAWNLRCSVRENLISFLQSEHANARSDQPRGPVIRSYRWNGMWVFDDPTAGLVRQPVGSPNIINRAVHSIPNAERGFLAVFSDRRFPGAQVVLDWVCGGDAGNWYRWTETGQEDWLSPALFRSYKTAPKQLYIAVRAAA